MVFSLCMKKMMVLFILAIFCRAALAEESQLKVRVTAESAKIHLRPSKSGRVLLRVKEGTVLWVVGSTGNWYQVKLPEPLATQTGYIHKREVGLERTEPAGPDSRQLRFKPEQPQPGETILFSALNFNTPEFLRWDFGDGNVVTAGGEGGMQSVAHSYGSSGTYQVRVFDWKGDMSTAPITTVVAVGLAAEKSLRCEPSSPTVNQMAILTALNFVTPDAITWDLGDGTRLDSGTSEAAGKNAMVSHVYRSPGIFKVQAYDWHGDQTKPAVTLEVKVIADPRSIGIEPANPFNNQTVVMTAFNFNTPKNILWDTGDQTPTGPSAMVSAGDVITYSYRTEGRYLVKAYDWNGDTSKAPVMRTIVVSQSLGKTSVEPQAAAQDVAEKKGSGVVIPEISAIKKFPLIKIGPYAAYFRPNQSVFREIYGQGDVIYGGQIAAHIWNGFYLWASYTQFRVIGKTTFSEDKTVLVLNPLTLLLRYTLPVRGFHPYFAAGYTFTRFKEESPIFPTVSGNGKNYCLSAGFEFQFSRRFILDLGARYERIMVKPSGEELDIGGLQGGASLLLGF